MRMAVLPPSTNKTPCGFRHRRAFVRFRSLGLLSGAEIFSCRDISISFTHFMLQRDDHQIFKRLLKLPALPLLIPLPRLLKLPYAFTHLFSVRRLILTEILIPPSRRMDRICPLIKDKPCQAKILCHHDVPRTAAIRQCNIDGILARV